MTQQMIIILIIIIIKIMKEKVSDSPKKMVSRAQPPCESPQWGVSRGSSYK